MRLEEVFSEVVGDQGGVKVTGMIRYDDGRDLPIWVEVPAELATAISQSGNPWVVAMLPIAASLGECIETTLPVDQALLENLQAILRIWTEWYPELKEVAFKCPNQAHAFELGRGTKNASYFSGGIDSYFTLARRLPGQSPGLPVIGTVDELITVWGFDIAVHDRQNFEPLARLLKESAAAIGLPHYVVRTNLRDNGTVWMRKWGPLTHAAGLAFIGLILEKRYRSICWGSTNPYGRLLQWGSHPMVDPLFSTSSLTCVHDGAQFTRAEKTDLVTRFPPARSFLHVCQASGVSNCSRCEKCFRTMVTIDALGVMDLMKHVFDWSCYSVSRINDVLILSAGNRIEFDTIAKLASAKGRGDIARAIARAKRRSRIIRPLIALAQWLNGVPFAWRFGDWLERMLKGRGVAQIYVSHDRLPG